MRSALPLAILASLPLIPLHASAQTCSCASVPLLGSMQPASTEGDEWFFATTYEHHEISDLVAGSSTVPDTTGRIRTATALVMEASRGVTDKWAVSALLSSVEHKRAIGGESIRTSGLGDAILLAKYSPRRISLYSDSALSFGFGARVPLGDDDLARDGVFLSEDLQSSTGANGAIAWTYWAKAMNDSGSAQIYTSASFTANGDNSRNYQFGDEATVSFGGSIQMRSPWGFAADISYRNANRDRRNNFEIPNTGGDWLDLNAGFQYRVSESLGIGFGGTFPLKRNLNDQLQFTTSYAWRASVSYVIGSER